MKIEDAIAEVNRAESVYGDRLNCINSVYRALLEAAVVLRDHASQPKDSADECDHKWVGLHGHPAAFECEKCGCLSR